ncbi:MAG: N-acetyltransferase [Bacteroidia bacterium]|nr:N-acetyltransferase [Bacteroidia bacterium]
MIQIRNAKVEDVAAITAIYNEAILNTTATFDTEIKSVENRKQWFLSHGKRHPIIVAYMLEMLVGWASVSAYSDRKAYDSTVEVSVYVSAQNRNRGIGKLLMEQITLQAHQCGAHNILSRITQGNASSIHIHEQLGYEHVGLLKEVGVKFGQLLSVHLMQKVFND